MSVVFRRGLVVDVINDLSKDDYNKRISKFKGLITNDKLKAFPRNTAIVKEITRGAAKLSGRELICYPFFSSHLSMPLKPGESVWFIFEDPENVGEIAYWISRVCEPAHAEDANFTFFSRSYVQQPLKSEVTSGDKFDGDEVDTGETQTFSYLSPTSDPKEMINLIGYASDIHKFEPVPRYTKRPGDLVIQGSNNALIMLGTERGHAARSEDEVAGSQNRPDSLSASAAIDIVVGRGNFSSTSGFSLTNELGLQEIDKREYVETEGDAHFPSDRARIYLTSDSTDTTAPDHPDELLDLMLPESVDFGSLNDKDVGSFAVVKADNLRLVSRSGGSIRIVKEPSDNPSSLDGCAVMLLNDGTTAIRAKRISLASYGTETGADQPYVRHSALKSLLESLLTDIQNFCKTLQTHVTPGFGAPSPQITSAATSLLLSVTNKQSQLKLGKVGSDDFASTTIFGE